MIATCSALRVFERIILVVPAIGRMAATYAVGLQLEDAYLKPELGLIRGLTAAEKERIVNLPYEKRSTAKAYVRPGDKDSLRIFRKTAAGAENGDGAYEVCWDRQQRAAFIATHELSGAFDFDDAQHLQVRREGREGGMQGGGVQQAQGLRLKSAPPPLHPSPGTPPSLCYCRVAPPSPTAWTASLPSWWRSCRMAPTRRAHA